MTSPGTRTGSIAARGRRLVDPRRIERQRLAEPLQLVLTARLDVDRRAQLAPGRLGDQDVLVDLAGRRLDPGRDVDRVADDAAVEPSRAADRARHDGARVRPRPDPQAGARVRVNP